MDKRCPHLCHRHQSHWTTRCSAPTTTTSRPATRAVRLSCPASPSSPTTTPPPSPRSVPFIPPATYWPFILKFSIFFCVHGASCRQRTWQKLWNSSSVDSFNDEDNIWRQVVVIILYLRRLDVRVIPVNGIVAITSIIKIYERRHDFLPFSKLSVLNVLSILTT